MVLVHFSFKTKKAVDIFGFKSIWISLKMWNKLQNIKKQLDTKLHFLIPGVTIANYARLKQKIDSIYFLNRRCFSLLVFEVVFVLEIEIC